MTLRDGRRLGDHEADWLHGTVSSIVAGWSAARVGPRWSGVLGLMLGAMLGSMLVGIARPIWDEPPRPSPWRRLWSSGRDRAG